MASTKNDPAGSNDHEDVRSRIEKLKAQAASMSGGPVTSGMAPGCPPEVEEQFWKEVLAFENAPQIEPISLLVRSGLTVKPPDEIDEEHLNGALWDVIRGLADLGIYLHSTNHLSDRELYVRLWNDVLHDAMELDPDGSDAAWHVDLVGGGSEEHIQLYLTHYADEKERRRWAQEYPDEPLPPHVEPPFNRDQRLPHDPL